MTPITKKQHIFFVDDEPAICRAAAHTLKRLHCQVSCFTNPLDCLEKLPSGQCDLLITDVKMPGLDGIEFVRRTKRIAPALPILVISGYGDIPLAVTAIKAGALDFLEKPLQSKSFLKTVKNTLKLQTGANQLVDKLLTKTEKIVLNLLLQGKSNKETASILHRSVRTIEDHRLHIMRKLNVDNAVDLAKRAVAIGLINPTQKQ